MEETNKSEENLAKFSKLGITGELLEAIKKENFENPSEIQEKSIPLILAGKDVIGESSTGSGKTLAFGSAVVQNTEHKKIIQALVMVPTRELAEQVSMSIKKFSHFKHLNIVSVYGGVGMGYQIDKLQTADVVVGTPGRILDHLTRRTVNLKSINLLVLDEADRMLDMGFVRDVEKIISQCNHERQTLLFSATLSSEISRLSKKHMKNPELVSVKNQVDPSKLHQVYYDVQDNQKFSLLVHLLKNEKAGLVMVFCNTKRMTDFVTKHLQKNGVEANAIHGGLSQSKRNSTLKKFHSAHCTVLVCTDVAARGLDIPGVSHVYNYDIPLESENYVHRIGRTARAGKEGIAISLLSSRDYESFSRINRRIADVKREDLPQFETIFIEKSKFSGGGDSRRGGFGGGRGRSFSRGRSEGGRGGFGGGRSFSRGRSSRFGSREEGDGERSERNFRPRRSFGGGEGRRRFGGNRNSF